jgi:tRNA_anti-like
MYNFRCPGCGKLHPSALPPEEVVDQRCLRCGEVFHLLEQTASQENKETAAEAQGSRAPAAAGTGQNGPGRSGTATERGWWRNDELIPLADGPLAEQPNLPGPATAEYPLKEEEQAPPDEPEPESEPGQRKRRPWLLIAGVAAGVLLAVGAGAYFLRAGKGSPRTAAKTEKTASASKSASKSKGKTTSAKTDVAKKTPPSTSPPPAVITKEMPVIHISAPRLSAELAANADETKQKYQGATLVISGLFARLDRTKPPFGVFVTVGPEVGCILDKASNAEVRTWANVPPRQAITVRGKFGADGRLHESQLVPVTAAADGKYRGKEVELTGYVAEVDALAGEGGFPSLTLESDTNGIVAPECLFRQSDAEELKKIKVGQLVTVSGTCNGRRSHDEYTYRVRLDNCRLVYSSAAVEPTPRLDVIEFLREYEEDLHAELRPLPGKEPVGPTVTIAQLEKEFETDPGSLQRKYANKVLTVTGRSTGKKPPTLGLVSGNTDGALKIYCVFARHQFARLDDRADYCIRGLFTNMPVKGTLRLDNCELYDPRASNDRRRATVEYFPYTPGKSWVYDSVTLPASGTGQAVVTRHVVFERSDGWVETLITHTGTLPAGQSLLHSKPSNWVLNKKTRKVSLPGPRYRYRISGTLIELGHLMPGKEGAMEILWHPVLRIGAMKGDSWQWSHGTERHDYTLEEFDVRGQRPCVIVRELVSQTVGGSGQTLEIRHIFGLDVGYLERQEIAHPTSFESRLIADMWLVEESGEQPGAKTPPKSAAPSTTTPKPPRRETSSTTKAAPPR